MAAILYIPTYPSVNKHSMVKKYITVILNLRPPKLNLSNVWDVWDVWDGHILLRYLERLEENTLLTIFTQKLVDKHDSTICVFTVDSVILNDMSPNFFPNNVLKHFKLQQNLNMQLISIKSYISSQ